jgi:hypothetical protein
MKLFIPYLTSRFSCLPFLFSAVPNIEVADHRNDELHTKEGRTDWWAHWRSFWKQVIVQHNVCVRFFLSWVLKFRSEVALQYLFYICFEVSTAIIVQVVVFCVVTPYSREVGYRPSSELKWHLSGIWKSRYLILLLFASCMLWRY